MLLQHQQQEAAAAARVAAYLIFVCAYRAAWPEGQALLVILGGRKINSVLVKRKKM